MLRDLAILVLPQIGGVPAFPFEAITEDAGWYSVYPLGRTARADVLVPALHVCSVGQEACVAVFGDVAWVTTLQGVARLSWTSTADLLEDPRATAAAIRTAWPDTRARDQSGALLYPDEPVVRIRAALWSPLDEARADARRVLAARTAALRTAGFAYAGKWFSLDHNAVRQVVLADRWAQLNAQIEGAMRYPLIWPSTDRAGFVALQDAAGVRAFALAYSLADRALTEQMAGLEMSIALATTVEDVAAVLATPVVP